MNSEYDTNIPSFAESTMNLIEHIFLVEYIREMHFYLNLFSVIFIVMCFFNKRYNSSNIYHTSKLLSYPFLFTTPTISLIKHFAYHRINDYLILVTMANIYQLIILNIMDIFIYTIYLTANTDRKGKNEFQLKFGPTPFAITKPNKHDFMNIIKTIIELVVCYTLLLI